MPRTIRIYGQPDCIWCARAKALCETRSFPYEYVDLSENPEARAALARNLGTEKFTVPQIYAHGVLIGGFTQLAIKDNSGELQQIIGGE
jgi:glutaredoxin 1